MSSTIADTTTVTRAIVTRLFPHVNDAREIKCMVYDAQGYYGCNGTLGIAVILGVVAPILHMISLTAAVWWAASALFIRWQLMKTLVNIESEPSDLSYKIGCLLGLTSPGNSQAQHVLKQHGYDPKCHVNWSPVTTFGLFELRAPLPARTEAVAGAVARVRGAGAEGEQDSDAGASAAPLALAGSRKDEKGQQVF